MENIKDCYIAIGLLYQNMKKSKFMVQVCGSKKSFAVAKMQKNIPNVQQTCGFAVANHPLLFCGCGIEFKFAVPSMLKSLSTAALESKEVLFWTNSFFSAASAKELSSIFFAGTAYRNPSIRFAAASCFGSDWLNKQPKKLSLLTDSTSLSLSPLSLFAPLVHNITS